ncbi:hypothetical protein GQ457_02G017310 [Hibiscus cannabinus]
MIQIISKSHIALRKQAAVFPHVYKATCSNVFKSRSRVVSTERTILSPFTKEYRVLSTPCGIRLFLEGLNTPPAKFKFQRFSVSF